jgi:hypothetical protein
MQVSVLEQHTPPQRFDGQVPPVVPPPLPLPVPLLLPIPLSPPVPVPLPAPLPLPVPLPPPVPPPQAIRSTAIQEAFSSRMGLSLFVT